MVSKMKLIFYNTMYKL